MRLRGERKHEFRLGESVELVPHEAEHEAICEMVALRAQGALRAIATAMAAKEGAIGSAMRAQRRPEGSRHLRGGGRDNGEGEQKPNRLLLIVHLHFSPSLAPSGARAVTSQVDRRNCGFYLRVENSVAGLLAWRRITKN
jgi:hypothetical protein